MSETQRHTVDLYYSILHTKAIANCLGSAFELGLMDELRKRPKGLGGIGRCLSITA